MRVEFRDSPEAYFWEKTMLGIVIRYVDDFAAQTL